MYYPSSQNYEKQFRQFDEQGNAGAVIEAVKNVMLNI